MHPGSTTTTTTRRSLPTRTDDAAGGADVPATLGSCIDEAMDDAGATPTPRPTHVHGEQVAKTRRRPRLRNRRCSNKINLQR
jgi:hypothetical protein